MSRFGSMRGGGAVVSAGSVVATSSMTPMTSGAANVKGAWAQLIAATPDSWAGFLLTLRNNANGRASIDVGIGAGGAEQILLPDLLHSASGLATKAYFPAGIAKGKRIAVRSQSGTAALIVLAKIEGIADHLGLPPGITAWSTVGFTAATTSGILLDGGGVANTDSAWVQLSAAIPRSCRVLYLCTTVGTGTPTANSDLLVDVGVGAGGAEQIVLEDLHVRHINGNHPSPHIHGPYPVNIPQGTRLAARVRSSSIDANGRLLHVTALLGE